MRIDTMCEMKKEMEIRRILKCRIVKMYIDNPQAMYQSLNWLEKELAELTRAEIVERYEYILEGEKTVEEHDGEYFTVVRYGRKMYITISLYDNGRKLDMRNKKVREYSRKGFGYNNDTKQFIRVAVV